MDSKLLNKRKNEILDQQTAMLQKATEAKVQLTEAEFDAVTGEETKPEMEMCWGLNDGNCPYYKKGKPEVCDGY